MGFTDESVLLFFQTIGPLDYCNLDLLELGDQELALPDGRLSSDHKIRDLYGYMFKSWTTYDLHETKGVTKFDLSVEANGFDTFDVITNFGTCEHVEPELGHYFCWKNIHKFLRKDGLIISASPLEEGWEDHCRYFYGKQFYLDFNINKPIQRRWKEMGIEITDNIRSWRELIGYIRNSKIRYRVSLDGKKFNVFSLNGRKSKIKQYCFI